ncbi:MAG TPA: hypothetical protein VFG03_01260, partial [Telluria sp.]|nr:hypothetical protein [Telluria sp.]
VGGSIWLDLFLAATLSQGWLISLQIKMNKHLFDINDAQLADVSAHVIRLEEMVRDLRRRLCDIDMKS